MFFKHFASKNQPPGLSLSGTLVENGLITRFICYLEKEKRDDIEISSIDRVLKKEYIYGKTVQKMHTKL